jgi:hypothetical protein
MAPQDKILTMSQCRKNAANGLAMYQRASERNCRLRVLVLTSARIGTTRCLDACKICRFRSGIGVRRLHFLQSRTRFPIA